MKNKNKFRVIEGGKTSKEKAIRKFESAYITNTRLMGVMAVCAQWKIEGIPGDGILTQFFYFDCEEFGFDSYYGIWENNIEKIKAVENKVTGGLGGENIDITERELGYIVDFYYRFNIEHGIELPEGEDEYKYILKIPHELDKEEKNTFFAKTCVKTENNIHTANYFLMRLYGRDLEPARFLSTDDIEFVEFDKFKISTLHKNTIEEDGDYLKCDSLIEFEGSYQIIRTKLEFKDGKVARIEILDKMKITVDEATMILSKGEFTTVFELTVPLTELIVDDFITNRNALKSEHESGTLFLVYKNNNNHVNKKKYLLADDVFGIIFITKEGQFIISAYSLQNIYRLEKELEKSSYFNLLVPIERYEFKEPILYDFIQSDFEDFIDFLEFISDDSE